VAILFAQETALTPLSCISFLCTYTKHAEFVMNLQQKHRPLEKGDEKKCYPLVNAKIHAIK
jgi:hypothetical protein